ncbi:uncharacterized protein LOC128961674 [Oppia nitens]|uniref:uncharacterized protein LOC128961674 n=1 Tax=Oppia nitens TaxID=1686743 RepID=UPI0023DC2A01|nr:uncharacterized protein LOC128961674 [Oppia nitens]
MTINTEKLKTSRKKLNIKRALELMADHHYREALAMFTTCITSDPNDFRLYVNRSYCYQQLDKLAKALSDANTAIGLNDSHIAGYYRKGCVMLASKVFRSAEQSFQRALQIDGNDANSRLKLRETHHKFLMEFGLSEDEANSCLDTEQYKTCTEITDGLSAGGIIRAIKITNGTNSVTSVESIRNGTDISDTLLTSFSDLSTLSEDLTLSDSMSIPGNSSSITDLINFDGTAEANNSTSVSLNCDEIRMPSSVPFKKRSSSVSTLSSTTSPSMVQKLIDGPMSQSNIKIDEISKDSLQKTSEDKSEETASKNLTPKSRFIKTRPQIRLSAK